MSKQREEDPGEMIQVILVIISEHMQTIHKRKKRNKIFFDAIK